MSFSLAIINASKIWTGTSSIAPVDALGFDGERILAIGSTSDILENCSETTQIIDASNSFVMPGFTDSHCHFLDGGLRLLSVQLRDVRSPEQFAERIQNFVQDLPEGTWVLGGDWDQHSWGGQLPDRSWIDAISPKHPVWLNRMDGHMALANSYALKIAGIDQHTSPIVGGEIVCDVLGMPTGLIKDNAMNLVLTHIPERSQKELDLALEKAMDYVAAQGITCVHTMVTVDCADGLWPRDEVLGKEDFTAAYRELETYASARSKGMLKTRIHAALPLNSIKLLQAYIQHHGKGDTWLKVDSVKAMMDGSLGSHTAAMQDDYDDTPGYRGHMLWNPAVLEEFVRQADAFGLQIKMHAIGDRCINEMLDLFEKIIKTTPSKDRRFRCEHAQHFLPQDIERFAQLGIVASMQPSHLADDGRWACNCIGRKRLQTSWPIRSLLDNGTKVAFGSDWFVTPPHPLEGIHAAVTRQTIDGLNPDGLIPEEKISIEQALRAYTQDAAYAGFVEKDLGSLEVGKLADIVILDQNILEGDLSKLLQTKVLATIVGGKVIYEAKR